MAMNLGYMLTRSACARPDHPAVIHGDRILTYSEFDRRVNRLVGMLRSVGLEAGDRVGILSPNCPEILEALFGIWKAGFVAVPMNFRLHPQEVAYILEHSGAKVLLYHSDLTAMVEEGMSCGSAGPMLIHFGSGRAAEGSQPYDGLLAVSQEGPTAEVSGDDLAWLFYTSGTTGRPKGAMLTHRIITMAVLNSCADIYPFAMDDVALHAAPLTHGSGFGALAVIAKGGTNVILESSHFTVETVFAAIERYRVTVLPFLAPTMVKRLADSYDDNRCDLRSLRCIIYGGAPMYLEDLVAGLKRFGPVFSQVFGQGECPMTITGLNRAEHDLDHPAHLTSAGTARVGVQIRILDQDGLELPPGAVGEIAVRSDMVMKGYWRNPEATRETIKNGWLWTGDLGYLDENGFLYIMDRSKDMLISGGNNIYPREVEEVLLRHSAVSEACVFGVPDPQWGESVKAMVVLRPGQTATEEELINHCKQHLASYKKPKSVEFVTELPKNNYGKVLKRELRAKYWTDSARKV